MALHPKALTLCQEERWYMGKRVVGPRHTQCMPYGVSGGGYDTQGDKWGSIGLARLGVGKVL